VLQEVAEQPRAEFLAVEFEDAAKQVLVCEHTGALVVLDKLGDAVAVQVEHLVDVGDHLVVEGVHQLGEVEPSDCPVAGLLAVHE